MALLDPALSSALQAIENQALIDAKAGNPWTVKQYCDAKASALGTQTKTATVSGTATGAMSGGLGVPVTGSLL